MSDSVEPSKFFVYGALFCAQLFWAAQQTVGKFTMNSGLHPFVLSGLRSLGSIPLLFICALLNDGRSAVFSFQIQRDFHWFVGLGFFGVVGNHLFLNSGAFLASASDGMFLQPLGAILTTTFAICLGREQFSALKGLAIALAVGGALIIVTANAPIASVSSSSRYAGLACFAASHTCFSLFIVTQKSIFSRFPPLSMLFWTFTFGGLVNVIVGSCYAHLVNWHAIPSSTWWSLAYIIVFGTLIAFFLMSYASKYLPSSIIGMAVCLQPAFASVMCWIVLGERVTSMHGIGALVICCGVGVVVHVRSREQEEEAAWAARAAQASERFALAYSLTREQVLEEASNAGSQLAAIELQQRVDSRSPAAATSFQRHDFVSTSNSDFANQSVAVDKVNFEPPHYTLTVHQLHPKSTIPQAQPNHQACTHPNLLNLPTVYGFSSAPTANNPSLHHQMQHFDKPAASANTRTVIQRQEQRPSVEPPSLRAPLPQKPRPRELTFSIHPRPSTVQYRLDPLQSPPPRRDRPLSPPAVLPSQSSSQLPPQPQTRSLSSNTRTAISSVGNTQPSSASILGSLQTRSAIPPLPVSSRSSLSPPVPLASRDDNHAALSPRMLLQQQHRRAFSSPSVGSGIMIMNGPGSSSVQASPRTILASIGSLSQSTSTNTSRANTPPLSRLPSISHLVSVVCTPQYSGTPQQTSLNGSPCQFPSTPLTSAPVSQRGGRRRRPSRDHAVDFLVMSPDGQLQVQRFASPRIDPEVQINLLVQRLPVIEDVSLSQ